MTKLLAPALAASVLVGGVAACTDDEPDAAPTPTTTEPSTTTTEAAPTDEEAIEQLIADWFEKGRRIGIGEAALSIAAGYLADPYLSEFEDFVRQRDADDQLAGRLDSRSHIDVESVEVVDGAATSTHCVIDADALLSETTGEVINDAVHASRVESTLAETADGWRISGRQTIERWEERTECGA